MNRNTEIENEKVLNKPPSLKSDVLFLLAKVGIIILIAALISTFIYGGFRNDDEGMDDSIKTGDFVIYYRLDKNYVANDVVAIKTDGILQTRRVVAVAGDTVDITEEGLTINGNLQLEPDITDETQRFQGGVSFPLTVGDGKVFLLGDKREESLDSRMYGPVKVQDTLGKVVIIVRSKGI